MRAVRRSEQCVHTGVKFRIEAGRPNAKYHNGPQHARLGINLYHLLHFLTNGVSSILRYYAYLIVQDAISCSNTMYYTVAQCHIIQ